MKKVDKEKDHVWKVTLLNCDCHDFYQVIIFVAAATNCSVETASQFAHVADELGSVVIYKGTLKECQEVVNMLKRGGLDYGLSQ